eukprot:1366069-Amorphochlora_amoeboformis.AAC.3
MIFLTQTFFLRHPVLHACMKGCNTASGRGSYRVAVWQGSVADKVRNYKSAKFFGNRMGESSL